MNTFPVQANFFSPPDAPPINIQGLQLVAPYILPDEERELLGRIDTRPE
jgi:hypothetical protein